MAKENPRRRSRPQAGPQSAQATEYARATSKAERQAALLAAEIQSSAKSTLPGWALLGPILLFAAASAWGVLEVHSSTDTWIGLAAGRQILQETNWLDIGRTFPKHDTFSFTFAGTVWYNQNWLSHVYFWLLHDTLGRSWVVFGTWAVAAGMFVLVGVAAWLRSGSWLAAIFGAALVAAASRDWLSARPATVQFFLFAALWVLFSALLAQRGKGRPLPWRAREPVVDAGSGRVQAGVWWPIILLVPLFLVWGNAHGSFVFGYALVGLFGACWAVARLAQLTAGRPNPRSPEPGLAVYAARGPAITDMQAAGGVIATAFALLLTIWLGPYGLENFTHPLKVVEDPQWREVSEWVPPYRPANFPPVQRFWIAFGVAVAAPIVALLLWLYDRDRYGSHPPTAGPGAYRAQALFFDVASVLIGVMMAMWARRFAPLLYILATPALVTWVMMLGRRLAAPTQRRVRDLLVVGTWAAAVVVSFITYQRIHAELIDPFPAGPRYDLLDRVTCYHSVPGDGIRLLGENQLKANVITTWTDGGAVMFHAPSSRVFMDGRAQQVYSIEHYRLFHAIQSHPDPNFVLAVLDRTNTDAALLPNGPRMQVLRGALADSREWLALYELQPWTLFLRVGSQPFAQLVERERSGRAWWPALSESYVARGLLWAFSGDDADVDRGVGLFRLAIASEPLQGLRCFGLATQLLMAKGRIADARAFVQQEQARLAMLCSVRWVQVSCGVPAHLPRELSLPLFRQLQLCASAITRSAPR